MSFTARLLDGCRNMQEHTKNINDYKILELRTRFRARAPKTIFTACGVHFERDKFGLHKEPRRGLSPCATLFGHCYHHHALKLLARRAPMGVKGTTTDVLKLLVRRAPMGEDGTTIDPICSSARTSDMPHRATSSAMGEAMRIVTC